jgi:WD40 repeat protein
LAAVVEATVARPRLWDLETGAEHATKIVSAVRLNCVALSPDGKTLATGGVKGTLVLWDVASGKPRHTLKGHKDVVLQVCFSADGRTLASAGNQDKTALVWDVATGQSRGVFQGHNQAVVCVALSADGSVLATGSGDATVKVWDVPGGK